MLAGGRPRLVRYGIADEEAFEVGLPCGGTVHVFVDLIGPSLIRELTSAIREEMPVALETRLSGDSIGEKRVVPLRGSAEVQIVHTRECDFFVFPLLPRPRMYVFGAIDHAAACRARKL